MRRTLVLLVAFLAFAGCTSTSQLRGTAEPLPSLTIEQVESDVATQDALRQRSIERYADFTLGVVEFSDDGHVKDETQKNQVFDMVRGTLEENGGILITFVHGWHHGADVCDSNIACFRKVLRGVARDPNRVNKGPVVGVYLAWRGDSLKRATWASFYDRKRAAHNVGQHAGSKVLLNLHYLYEELNDGLKERREGGEGGDGFVTMVTAGHSFGGAFVFSAVEDALVSEWRGEDAVGPLEGQLKPERASLGDLVILVNPAFEARRYGLFDRDLHLPGEYEPQCPVLMTVASRGDGAVGLAFPLGRFLYLLWHPLRWRHFAAELRGAGHYGPQITHDLTYAGAPEQMVEDPSACTCPYPSPAEMREVAAEIQRSLGATVPAGREDCAALRSAAVATALPDKISLKARRPDFDQSSPYVVMQTNANLIPDHSDIYNPNFVKFLVAYLNLYLQQSAPEDEEPE